MAPWLIPAIAGAVQLGGQLIEGRQAKKATDRMNEYNSPKNQMARFQEAGLNKHLIYGQGNAGNQSAPTPTPNFSRLAEVVPLLNQTKLAESQISAQGAQTARALAQTDLTKIQQKVAESNPLINADYLESLVAGMRSTAEIKASEAQMSKAKTEWFNTRKQGPQGWEDSNGFKKMQAELDLLIQRYDLGNIDKSIKAEVVNGKKFNNAILEVQKNFMADGDITPQHIFQFLQLLLLKLL